MNQIKWVPETLQEAKEQMISSSIAQTLGQQGRQSTKERLEKGKEHEKEATGKRPR